MSRVLTTAEMSDLYKRFAVAFAADPRRELCGIVCASSWHDPVACAFRPGHDGDHSWASIPQFEPAGERPVGTGPTAAELAATVTEALDYYSELADRRSRWSAKGLAPRYFARADLAALVALAERQREALERLENATRILDVMLREPAAEGLMSVEDYRAYVQGAWLGVDEAAEAARAVLAGGAGDDPPCPHCGMTSQVEPSRMHPGMFMCHGCAEVFDAGGAGE